MSSLADDAAPYRWYPCAYLYVIVIGANRIKVGKSTNPARRLMQHRRLAEAHGAQHGRQWVSYPCSDVDRLEDELIDFCAGEAEKRFSREYFQGLDFRTVVDVARDITNGRGTWCLGPSVEDEEPALVATAAFERVVRGRAQGTVAQAATWLGVSECRIRELLAAGDLWLIKGERQDRIPVLAMRTWLRGRQSQPDRL